MTCARCGKAIDYPEPFTEVHWLILTPSGLFCYACTGGVLAESPSGATLRPGWDIKPMERADRRAEGVE